MNILFIARPPKRWLLATAILLSCCYLKAQKGIFNSHTRAADGRPGAGYWQNRADYKVSVSFDTASRTVNGAAIITYTNNSLEELPFIWLVAAQNRFKKDSRGAILTPNGSRFGVGEYTNGYEISSLQAGTNNKKLQSAKYQETDTYIKVLLPTPLLPGKKAIIRIAYSFLVPHNGSDYMGILATANGAVYQIGSLFPRVAVYDAVQGWSNLSGGFYIEPGALDVNFTVPTGLIVQGTGELINPEEVLSPAMLAKYKMAATSDSVIQIRSAADVIADVKHEGTRTWRFKGQNCGDGLWAISAAFIWDAVMARMPDGRKVLAMALYPPESNNEWQSITGHMKQILETYSQLWTPYPYNTAVNIAGSVTGIAAPGVTFIDYKKSGLGNNIWTKTNHEIGHNWFNIMVASDSKNGWMCEGLNTFINIINCDTLGGEMPFKMRDVLIRLSANIKTPALNTPASSVEPQMMAMVMYIKPAVALTLLRNKIIGKEKFDPVFRDFIKSWSFKHPIPEDFFRFIENGTAEDLGWFWKSWFFNDWKLDQAVTYVVTVNKDSPKGVDITLTNHGQMIMPAEVEITLADGTSSQLKFPAQIWQAGNNYTFYYPSSIAIEKVTIDPKKELPDTERTNNSWKK